MFNYLAIFICNILFLYVNLIRASQVHLLLKGPSECKLNKAVCLSFLSKSFTLGVVTIYKPQYLVFIIGMIIDGFYIENFKQHSLPVYA